MFDLSIIIVNYNGKNVLQNCLNSIVLESREISYEIIVVDNNSTDGSADNLEKKYLPTSNLKSFKVIKNSQNLGFSKANNIALSIARGNILCLLNNDTLIKDQALDKVVALMKADPKVKVVAPKLLNIDETPQKQGGSLGAKFWLSTKPIEIKFAIAAAFFVTREVYEKVGPLDENFFFYNEDIDWCIRIRKAGYRIIFYPEAEIIHLGGYTTKREFNKEHFLKTLEGSLYFCRKHYGFIPYLIGKALLSVVRVVLNFKKEKA